MCEEHLTGCKRELEDVRKSLLSSDQEESEELIKLQADLEKAIFDCSLAVKKSLQSHTLDPVSSNDGMKLPKLDVPTFDGNILNWKTFWEQFSISVHDRTNLSDPEKLVYLCHSLKDGSAKTCH